MATPQLHDQIDDRDGFVDELKPGTKLLHGQYTIESFLNAGGFGITYLARDSLDRKVVIKECFPGAFCRRSRYIVQARSRAHQNELKSIVRLFVQEARSLAKLDHPNIVGVHQVFEDNETAYMALDFVEGRDLLEIIEDPQTTLTPAQTVLILREVLGAVGFIHDQGMLHRDISPDNILISQDNQPVLIDFGAAREQASKQSRVLSALRVVKDGYSPQEFYIAGSDQSPSSDLYALAATFHHLVSGDLPPNSQSRLAAIASGDPDPYEKLAGRVDGYDDLFLASLDKALSVLPKDRLQSAKAWLDMMDGLQGNVTPLKVGQPIAAASATPPKSKMSALIGAAAAIAVIAGAGFVLTRPDQAAEASADAPTQAATPVAAAPVVAEAALAAPVQDLPSAPPEDVAAAPAPTDPPTPAQMMADDTADAPAFPVMADIGPATDTATPDLILPDTPPVIASVGAGPVVEIDAVSPGNAVSVAGLEIDTLIRLPFVAAGERSNIIAQATPEAPEWVQPGLVVTDVNGVDVSAISDIPMVLQQANDTALDNASVAVTFGLRNPASGDRVEQDATLTIVQSLALPTGHVFETGFVDGNWRSVVTDAPLDVAGGLQTGDILMTYIPTSEPLSDRDSLASLFEREVAQGTENLIFAVQRDGSMWVASLTYTDIEN